MGSNPPLVIGVRGIGNYEYANCACAFEGEAV